MWNQLQNGHCFFEERPISAKGGKIWRHGRLAKNVGHRYLQEDGVVKPITWATAKHNVIDG